MLNENIKNLRKSRGLSQEELHLLALRTRSIPRYKELGQFRLNKIC